MIQFNTKISILYDVYIYIYGVIDNLYQKMRLFKKIFSLHCIRLSTVDVLLCVWGKKLSRNAAWLYIGLPVISQKTTDSLCTRSLVQYSADS